MQTFLKTIPVTTDGCWHKKRNVFVFLFCFIPQVLTVGSDYPSQWLPAIAAYINVLIVTIVHILLNRTALLRLYLNEHPTLRRHIVIAKVKSI